MIIFYMDFDLHLQVQFEKRFVREAEKVQYNNHTVTSINNQALREKEHRFLLTVTGKDGEVLLKDDSYNINELFEKAGHQIVGFLAKLSLDCQKHPEQSESEEEVLQEYKQGLLFVLNYESDLSVTITEEDQFRLTVSLNEERKIYEASNLRSCFRQFSNDIYNDLLHDRKIEIKI